MGNLLGAKPDSYAKRQGSYVLGSDVVRISDALTVWNFVRALGSKTFRVLYRCQDGMVRDIIGRQGVYDSAQDGAVQGVGGSMAQQGYSLSFWTNVHGGRAVNTGVGKGYRTLLASGILALRVDGVDILTDAGIKALAKQITC